MAFVWLVLGSLFIGGMHDYFSGMISVRHKGKTFAEITGIYLGKKVLMGARVFNIILLMLLGVVFIKGPSGLLANLFGEGSFFANANFWLTLITIYAMMATLFPVDKLIGKIYPLFGVLFILMALGLLYWLVFMGKAQYLPAFSTASLHYDTTMPIWPILCVTIACGAVSGFHATQTPIISRCLAREIPDGRQIFYGAMIAEAVIALVWAAASMVFFEGMGGFSEVMAKNNNNPAVMVNLIASTWFGKVGGIIAILSVVVAPITSADSSFRVLRMSIADWFKISQNPMRNRLLIAVPMFAIAIILMQIDFAIIWRYFAFSNQTLATIMLWTGAMYLVHHKRAQFHWFLSLPAGFMTAVVVTYICVAPEGLHLSSSLSNTIGIITAVILYGIFLWKAGTFNVNAKNEGQEPVLEGDV